MNQLYLASTINIQADHLFIQEVNYFNDLVKTFVEAIFIQFVRIFFELIVCFNWQVIFFIFMFIGFFHHSVLGFKLTFT